MSKIEFLKELEVLLYAISVEERDQALQYYRDYFEDAGIENEQEVVRALGSPKQVADTILAGLADEDGSKGEFNESGFSGYTDVNRDEVAEVKKTSKFNSAIIILVVIIGVFISPFFGTLGSGILGIIFTVIVFFICLIFGVAIIGFSMVITSVYLLITGMVAMFSTTYAGMCLLGAGCVMLGVGILFILGGVKIITKAIPWIIRTIVKICKLPFSKKEEHV